MKADLIVLIVQRREEGNPLDVVPVEVCHKYLPLEPRILGPFCHGETQVENTCAGVEDEQVIIGGDALLRKACSRRTPNSLGLVSAPNRVPPRVSV